MNVIACDFFVPVGDFASLRMVLQTGLPWWWQRTGMQQVGTSVRGKSRDRCLKVICMTINAVIGLCSDKPAQINKPVYKAASDFPCAPSIISMPFLLLAPPRCTPWPTYQVSHPERKWALLPLQPPIGPHLGVGTPETLPWPCCHVGWFDLVQVATVPMSSCM